MQLPADIEQHVHEARAIVRFCYPWWLRPFLSGGVVAITLGRRIYLDEGISDLPRLLRHELAHVRQVERLGIFRFYWRYLREYVANRRCGWSSAEAYRRISLELEAFAAEREETL